MKDFPQYSGSIPAVNKEQMVEIDRLMINQYKISLIQMMENAGRSLAQVAQQLFVNKGEKIAILVGTGGNGGGGLVAGRNLLNWGYDVTFFLSKNFNSFKKVPKHQLEILLNMNAKITEFSKFKFDSNYDLIIDAIFGYNVSKNPEGNPKLMIEWINSIRNNAKTLSLDLPSGIGPNGNIYDPVIIADATLTLALPKTAFFQENVKPFIGTLYLADISVPMDLYNKFIFKNKIKPIFKENSIIKIY